MIWITFFTQVFPNSRNTYILHQTWVVIWCARKVRLHIHSRAIHTFALRYPSNDLQILIKMLRTIDTSLLLRNRFNDRLRSKFDLFKGQRKYFVLNEGHWFQYCLKRLVALAILWISKFCPFRMTNRRRIRNFEQAFRELPSSSSFGTDTDTIKIFPDKYLCKTPILHGSSNTFESRLSRYIIYTSIIPAWFSSLEITQRGFSGLFMVICDFWSLWQLSCDDPLHVVLLDKCFWKRKCDSWLKSQISSSFALVGQLGMHSIDFASTQNVESRHKSPQYRSPWRALSDFQADLKGN